MKHSSALALTIGLLFAMCGVPTSARDAAPPSNPPLSPCRVTANASKTEVTVGEVFTVDVTASGPAGASFVFPKDAGGESIELRTPELRPKEPPPAPGVHRYEAAAFAMGDAAVPAIGVKCRLPGGEESTVNTEPIPLKIVSVLPKDPKEQKLADIRAPLALAISPAFYISLAILVLLVALAVHWLWRRRRRRLDPSKAPAEPEIPPAVDARDALARLVAQGLMERGEFRAFYIALTHIAKRYLERRLEQPVVEMTSSEMVAFMRNHPHAASLASPMRDLSGAADRIKFARAAGLSDEAARHLGFVRGMIDSIEERLRPREEPAPDGKASGKAA